MPLEEAIRRLTCAAGGEPRDQGTRPAGARAISPTSWSSTPPRFRITRRSRSRISTRPASSTCSSTARRCCATASTPAPRPAGSCAARVIRRADEQSLIMRALFLAASDNRWLREHGVRAPFVRRAVSRFMPGETFDDMLQAARALARAGDPQCLHAARRKRQRSGRSRSAVADHYLEGIDRIRALGLACEPSVKPTQLGLDIDRDEARQHLQTHRASARRPRAAISGLTWSSRRTSTSRSSSPRSSRASFPGVGVCLQAYLHRTRDDLGRMLRIGAGVRLVKGAYREPPAVALADEARRRCQLPVAGPHDARRPRARRRVHASCSARTTPGSSPTSRPRAQHARPAG